MTELKTIDAHVGGAPVRLIVGGFPAPRGTSMLDKRDWVVRHASQIRRMLMLEPRGHRDLSGAVFTEPVSPGSHAGLLSMNTRGYGFMSGQSIIGAVAIALARALLVPGGEDDAVTLDTPAGTVRARRDDHRVSFVNVPAFVLEGGVEIRVDARTIRADIAFGGEFYAIVDAESAGLVLDDRHAGDLRRAGVAIGRAIDQSLNVIHPALPRVNGVEGTIFIGPSHEGGADLRSVAVSADGAIDRSACGGGVAAVIAVLEAMGLVDIERALVLESIIGTTLTGRVIGRTTLGDRDGLITEIQGSAWITGDHVFIVDEGDPLRDGFLV